MGSMSLSYEDDDHIAPMRASPPKRRNVATTSPFDDDDGMGVDGKAESASNRSADVSAGPLAQWVPASPEEMISVVRIFSLFGFFFTTEFLFVLKLLLIQNFVTHFQLMDDMRSEKLKPEVKQWIDELRRIKTKDGGDKFAKAVAEAMTKFYKERTDKNQITRKLVTKQYQYLSYSTHLQIYRFLKAKGVAAGTQVATPPGSKGSASVGK
jgi:hypothetical protein